jgi:hypothetical protein
MADHTITLTDEQEALLAWRVARLNEARAREPRPTDPLTLEQGLPIVVGLAFKSEQRHYDAWLETALVEKFRESDANGQAAVKDVLGIRE